MVPRSSAFLLAAWKSEKVLSINIDVPKYRRLDWAGNHGPRIVASRYFIRFWEPRASRICNRLPIDWVLSRKKQGLGRGTLAPARVRAS